MGMHFKILPVEICLVVVHVVFAEVFLAAHHTRASTSSAQCWQPPNSGIWNMLWVTVSCTSQESREHLM